MAGMVAETERSEDMNPKLKRVLSWVNRMRAKHFGKGPLETLPKGIQGKGAACPIHNSFWKPYCGGVAGVNYSMYEEDFIIRHPQYIQDFVLDFDHGKYPELEK